MGVINYKCKTCGGQLNYDINLKKLVCVSCRSTYDISDYEEKGIREGNLEVLVCNNCGAKVVGNDTIFSTTCIYCRSNLIVKKKLEEKYKPDFIIPFKRKQKEIIDIFGKYLKSSIFSNKDFFNEENIISINSLYVPYWLISCDAMYSIKGTLTSQDNNHNYVSKPFSRLCELKLERVPADAKVNLDNAFLQGVEPFNYDELEKFDYPYLLGSIAEYYDEDKETVIHSQIKERVEEAAYTNLSKSLRGGSVAIHSKQTYIGKEKFESVLMPIWFVSIKYRDKVYDFCINDQTGKVSGIRYLNKLKVALAFTAFSIPWFLSGNLVFILGSIDSLLLNISFFIWVVGFVYGYIKIYGLASKYTNISKGKKSVDYIKEETYKQLFTSDQF